MRAHRVDKLASTIREFVGQAIATRLQDPRISPLASVTRVELSDDLQVAKVYVSVYGDAARGRTTMAGLDHAAGRVQRMLARQLTLRRCPEVRFFLDESIKKGAETLRLIEESVRDLPPLPPAGEAAGEPDKSVREGRPNVPEERSSNSE